MKGAETATSPAERTWFEADRRLREGRTLRDIGIWSRYVGDASQPLLVTVHHDGWGNYPNPNGYTMANIHARVGSSFVRHNLERSTVAAEVEPFKDCKCSIGEQTRVLLLASLAQVGPLYALEKQGGFERSDPRGIAFATRRLAAGAQATRDMIVNAWLDSANTPVGYPMVNVRDIESGEVRATPELFRTD